MPVKSAFRSPLKLGERHDLVMEHAYRVPIIADLVLRELPRGAVEREDLIGCGNMRLVQCSNRFDPSRGTTFATYASLNIEGAMRDHIRGQWRRRAEVALEYDVLDVRNRLDEVEVRLELGKLLRSATIQQIYIIRQHFLAGRSVVHLAGDLRRSPSFVYATIRRAMQTMRAQLQP